MDPELLKFIGGSGVAGVALFILARVVTRVIDRLIAAVDRIAVKVDDHTAADLASHADLREAIVRIDAKMDGAANERDRMTPVEGVPIAHEPTRRTPPRGVPSEYFHRPGTKGERP